MGGGEWVIDNRLGGALLGAGQGVFNTLNGVTDIGIGLVNLGVSTSPAGHLLAIGGVDTDIESPDWSNGLITEEDPELHEWSKTLGGNGAVTLATIFLAFIPKGFKSGDRVYVDIRTLVNPPQQPVPLAHKLAHLGGKFLPYKYINHPAHVLLKRNGTMVIQNGVHRIHLARIWAEQTGVWELPVILFR